MDVYLLSVVLTTSRPLGDLCASLATFAALFVTLALAAVLAATHCHTRVQFLHVPTAQLALGCFLAATSLGCTAGAACARPGRMHRSNTARRQLVLLRLKET